MRPDRTIVFNIAAMVLLALGLLQLSLASSLAQPMPTPQQTWKWEPILGGLCFGLAFSVPSAAWLVYALRRWLREELAATRSNAGRCEACGYDLRATPERCPECGQAV